MDYKTNRENHRGDSAILFRISMNQLYLAGLFLLICGTMLFIKIKWSRIADLLGVVTTSYLFVGLALAGIKIYLLGLFLLGSWSLFCMKNINCRGAEPLALLTEYYIFIGLVVNGIIYFKPISQK
jgi:hypothetical protein